MRTCRLVAVHGLNGVDFAWEWRSERGSRRSSRRFGLFHDCMDDARSHGYEVVMDRPTGPNAPAQYALPPRELASA